MMTISAGQDTPKTYAENANAVASKDSKMQLGIQQQKQREILRQDKAKLEVSLSTKEMSESEQKSIVHMSPKEITELCQKAINRMEFICHTAITVE